MITEIIIAGLSFFQPQTQQDSLGIETVNGKTFVVHKVSEKETLYGISRRYGSTVDAVLEYNPTAASGLEIGQILKVPYTKPTPTTKSTSSGGGIVHVVAPKETMFSISKAYNVSMEEIRQWNNLPDNNLSIGQELTIRKRNTAEVTATSSTNAKTNSDAVVGEKGTHVVAPKETMYSIARQYSITVDQLREWNNINGNDLKIGQALIVSKPSVTTSTVAVVVPDKPTEINKVTKTTEENTASDRTLSDKPSQETTTQVRPEQNNTTAKTETVVSPPIRITESIRSGDEVSEGGLAELIEGTEGNRKYLALHRTAPVGSILKVKNEMNNREVFVRVTGKLQDNALADKVVIKISKSAYDRLGAIDPRFRVQVTYYK